jgi:hypothetical protein
MTRLIVGVVLSIVLFQFQAQSNEKLVGTWKLISAKITTDKGEVRDSWGPILKDF